MEIADKIFFTWFNGQGWEIGSNYPSYYNGVGAGIYVDSKAKKINLVVTMIHDRK